MKGSTLAILLGGIITLFLRALLVWGLLRYLGIDLSYLQTFTAMWMIRLVLK